MRILTTLIMLGAPALTPAHELGDSFGPVARVAHHWFSLHHLPALILVAAIVLGIVAAVRKATSKS
jgi:hypothetical protein